MPNCQPYLGTALSVQGTSINTNERKLNNPDTKIIPKLPLVIKFYTKILPLSINIIN